MILALKRAHQGTALLASTWWGFPPSWWCPPASWAWTSTGCSDTSSRPSSEPTAWPHPPSVPSGWWPWTPWDAPSSRTRHSQGDWDLDCSQASRWAWCGASPGTRRRRAWTCGKARHPAGSGLSLAASWTTPASHPEFGDTSSHSSSPPSPATPGHPSPSSWSRPRPSAWAGAWQSSGWTWGPICLSQTASCTD